MLLGPLDLVPLPPADRLRPGERHVAVLPPRQGWHKFERNARAAGVAGPEGERRSAETEGVNRDALSLELVRLERDAARLQQAHERIRERLGAFPNVPAALARKREVAGELEAVNERPREIETQLRAHAG